MRDKKTITSENTDDHKWRFLFLIRIEDAWGAFSFALRLLAKMPGFTAAEDSPGGASNRSPLWFVEGYDGAAV